MLEVRLRMGLQLLQLEQWSILWRRLAKEKKKKLPCCFQRSLYFSDVAGHHVDRCTMSSHPSVLSETAVSACYLAVKHLIAIS